MPQVSNISVWKRVEADRNSYVLFVDWNDIRLSQIWGLDGDFIESERSVAHMMIESAQKELDEHGDLYSSIGAPVSDPLPAWLEEDNWEPVDI